MDYKKAWKELESVVSGNLMIYDFVFKDESPNFLERSSVNTLKSIDRIMKGLRKKHSKGGVVEGKKD